MDPSDIGKYPDLIKKAQAEIACTDVLVCGRCHSVFHLIELFREHKEHEPDCKRTTSSTLHNCDEAQGKVWAFLLWKSAQRQAAGEERNPGQNNSWKLYQTWVKLEESVRDTWIVAGKTIQSFSKTGAGSLQEMPVKITKTILEPPSDGQDKKTVPAVGAQGPNRFTPTVRKPGDIKPNTPAGAGGPAVESKNRIVVGAQLPQAMKKTEPGTVVKAGPVTTTPGTPTRRSYATRTHPKSGAFSEEEVEKILAKRFSPIIKMHEYLVKWARMTNDQNTWEPLTHLHSCQSILEHFEVQLAKQKEQRAATAARALQLQRQEKGGAAKPAGASATASTTGTVNTAATTTTTTSTSPGSAAAANQLRPMRNSKTSAMDRVKQWTAGNRSPGDSSEDMASGKRKHEDGDTDGTMDGTDGGPDGVAKKVKTEPSSASDTLAKATQGANVKILSGSGSGTASGIIKTAVNGGTGSVGSAGKDGNAAEVVIIKTHQDGVASGISKKVPLLPTGGGNSNSTVVTRLSPRGTDVAAKSSPKTAAASGVTATAAGAATTTTLASRPMTISTPISTTDSSGVTTRFIRRNVDGTEQLVKQTIRKAPKLVPFSPANQQRPVGTVVGVSKQPGTPVPKVTTSAALGQQRVVGASPRVISAGQQKSQPVSSRVVGSGTPGNVVRSATMTRTLGAPSSDQKLNALRRQGVHVMKRVITTSTVAGGSAKKATVGEEEESEAQGDGSAANVQQQQQQQPVAPPSPPPAMTLCPVTGKVLAQAEGEPTPVPSPEAEPEEKKVTPKADSAGGAASSEAGADGAAAGEQMVVAAGGDQTDTQVQQLLTNEDGSPIIVAGEDGTLYQVAGKNAEGQTILIAQGADGEQSCVLVASQEGEEEGTAGAAGTGGVLTLDAAVSEAVAVPQEGQEMTEEQVAQYQQSVDTNQELTIQTEDSQDNQITAEVVQADPASPGGTRRVVLLLPDGNLMVTEVNDETYQTLNLVN
ncbi:mucin-22 isoform X4 [Anopheles merus]|uniref:mucin-22 isoform X4 n=1 Tax=Anopheles merus TaxID=30066 RepID=UPI001BE45B95|nr:mucin-22 isoform X4 [Anopheles merus]